MENFNYSNAAGWRPKYLLTMDLLKDCLQG